MKVAEILRSLIDAIDRVEVVNAVPQAHDEVQNIAQPANVESNNVEDPHDLFLPPLQMKMELLKKAVGVENVYDDGTDAEQEETEVGDPGAQQDTGFEQELEKMKKIAGLNPVITTELSDDEPLES